MAIKLRVVSIKLRVVAIAIILALILTYLSYDFVALYFEDPNFGRCNASKISIPRNGLDRDCQCKKIPHATLGKLENYCSEFSTSRGPRQKIISFSFYGGFKSEYYEGIKYNVEGVKKYYPGYIMRLYHDMENPYMREDGSKAICELYCKEDILDLCNVRYIDWYRNLHTYFGMLWRFAPMADPLVIEWHSRDLDSRITEREISAVDDWKASGKTYHLMRDNPHHGSYIVGCCFGMKITKENSVNMKSDFDYMLLRSQKVWKKGLDQHMLNKYVWPRAKYDMVAHDSYLCNTWKYSYADNKPWPTKRLEGEGLWNFVGSNGGTITLKTHGECPTTCRPKDNQDWTLC